MLHFYLVLYSATFWCFTSLYSYTVFYNLQLYILRIRTGCTCLLSLLVLCYSATQEEIAKIITETELHSSILYSVLCNVWLGAMVIIGFAWSFTLLSLLCTLQPKVVFSEKYEEILLHSSIFTLYSATISFLSASIRVKIASLLLLVLCYSAT